MDINFYIEVSSKTAEKTILCDLDIKTASDIIYWILNTKDNEFEFEYKNMNLNLTNKLDPIYPKIKIQRYDIKELVIGVKDGQEVFKKVL